MKRLFCLLLVVCLVLSGLMLAEEKVFEGVGHGYGGEVWLSPWMGTSLTDIRIVEEQESAGGEPGLSRYH